MTTPCPHCGFPSPDAGPCPRCGQGADTFEQELGAFSLTASLLRGPWPADARQPRLLHSPTGPLRVYSFNRGWWRDLRPTIERRAATSLEILAPVRVVPRAREGVLVVASGLPGARPVVSTEAWAGGPLQRLDRALAECRTLASALAPLHAAGLVWLNFDPICLEASGDQIQITNLDLEVFPAGEYPESLIPSLLHVAPETALGRADRLGPATDVYHLALHAYYRLANLYPAGFPGQGPAAFGFDVPPLRIYVPDLPPGVLPVLQRGLAIDARRRFPTVADFLSELETGVAHAHVRAGPRPPVRCSLAGRTVTGRAKEARGQVNQDVVDVFEVSPGEGLQAVPVGVVADGVTVARIGTGEVASHTACAVLRGHLPQAVRQGNTPEALAEELAGCCLAASAAIARQAQDLGPLPDDFDPSDLMGSTALIGLVRDGVLTLANVGDSRAYLVSVGKAEQLTVDGDVRSVQLAQGSPPEEVRALGEEALTLYSCLGVCELGSQGDLVLSRERCAPAVTRWPLLPGDVVVLCSDGLVEEGVFLHPLDVARLVEAHRGLPADELAALLVAEADARQTLPDERFSEGVGDNIACVVFKVEAVPDASAGPPGPP